MGFLDTAKSGLTTSGHIGRVNSSGERLGAPVPSQAQSLDDCQQITFSFLTLFLHISVEEVVQYDFFQ